MTDQRMRFADAGAVRAVIEGSSRRLEVLAAPFGGPDRVDRLSQWFTPQTDFMIEVGDRRPTLYLHGFSPQKRAMLRPVPMGVATAIRVDRDGLWMVTELDDSPLATRTWEAALQGRARASTGSIDYLVRPMYRDGKAPPGPVEVWPIAELTVFDAGEKRVPVSDDAIVLPLRALFQELDLDLPAAFEAGEDKDDQAEKDRLPIRSTGGFTMEPEVQAAIDAAVAASLKATADAAAVKETERAAMRAEILKGLGVELDDKGQPKHRAIFNVNKGTSKVRMDPAAEKRGATIEQLEENHAFFRALLQDAKIVAQGGVPRSPFVVSGDARRTLEETEAAELQSMVPTDVANQIHALLGKYSIVRKSGMRIAQTDKLIFSIPAETTAVTEAATIAEEGAYTTLEGAFGAKTATMLKKGGWLKATEEGLEDQDLFQQWLPAAAARSMALAENTVLEALLATIDGVEIAVAHTPTDAEIVAGYYALAQEYRDGAVFLMNDLTLAYLRSMLVATPRAYGEFGFQPMSMGELGETFLNKRVFTNANWDPVTTAADDVKIIDFVNLDECLWWVERRGISIFVDPYTERASGGTIQFLISARFNGAITNSAALSGVDDHA
jgi:HK97 family phage major capsid protein